MHCLLLVVVLLLMSITPTFLPDSRSAHAYTSLHSETLLQSDWNQSMHSSNVNPHSNHFGDNHPLLLLATAAVVPFLVRFFLHAINVMFPNLIFLCITRSFFQRESIIVEEPIHSSSRCSSDRRNGNTIWSSGTLIDAIMLYAAYCLEKRKVKEKLASKSTSKSLGRDAEPKEKKCANHSLFGKWLCSSVSTVFHFFSPPPPQAMLRYGQFLYAPVNSNTSSSPLPTNVRSANKRKDLKKVLKEEYYLSVVPPEDRSVEVEPGLWLRFEGCDAISRQSSEYYSGKHKKNAAGRDSSRHKRKRRHRQGFGGAEGEEEGFTSYWMSDFIRADEERAKNRGAKAAGSSFMDTNGTNRIGAPLRNKSTAMFPFSFLDALKRPFPLKHRFSSRKKGDVNAPPKWWRRGNVHPHTGKDKTDHQQGEEDDNSSHSSRSTDSGASSHSSENEDSSENRDEESAYSPEVYVPSRRVWLYCCDTLRGRVTTAANDASFLQWEAEELDEYGVRRRWWKEKVLQEEEEERRSDFIHHGGEQSQSYSRKTRHKGVVGTAILEEEEALAATPPKPPFSSTARNGKRATKVSNASQEKTPSSKKNDENRSWNIHGWGITSAVARIWNIFPFRSFPSSVSSNAKDVSVSRLDHFIRRAYLWYHYRQLLQEENHKRGRETCGGGGGGSGNTSEGIGSAQHTTRRKSTTDTPFRDLLMETVPCRSSSSSSFRCGLNFPLPLPLERKRYAIFPSKPELQERIDAAMKWNEKLLEGGAAENVSLSEDEYGSDDDSSNVVDDGVLWSVKRYEILNSCPTDAPCARKLDKKYGTPPHMQREKPHASVGVTMAENDILMASISLRKVPEERQEGRGEVLLQEDKEEEMEADEEKGRRQTNSLHSCSDTTLFQHYREGEAGKDMPEAHVSRPNDRPYEQDQMRNERKGKKATQDGAKATEVDDDDENVFESLFIPQREALRKRLIDFKKRKGPYAKPGYPQRLYILLSPGKEGSVEENRPLSPSTDAATGEGMPSHGCDTNEHGSKAAVKSLPDAWDSGHSIAVEEEEGAMEMEAVTMSIVKEVARYLQRSIVILSLKSVLTNQYVNSWLSGCQLRCEGEEEYVSSNDYDTDSSSCMDSNSGKFVPKKTRLRPSNVVYWIQDIEEAESVVEEVDELSRHTEKVSERQKKEKTAVRRHKNEKAIIKIVNESEEEEEEGGKTEEEEDGDEEEGQNDDEEENDEEGEMDDEGEDDEDGEIDDEEDDVEKGEMDDEEEYDNEEKEENDEEGEEEEESEDHERTPSNSSAINFKKALTEALSRAACAVAEEHDSLSFDGLIRVLVPQVASVSGRVVIMSSKKRVGEAPNALTSRWIQTPLLINLHLPISCSIQAPEVLQILRYYHLYPTPMEEEVIQHIFPLFSRMSTAKGDQLRKEVEKEDHSKTLRVTHSFLQDCCFRYQSVREVLHASCTAKLNEFF